MCVYMYVCVQVIVHVHVSYTMCTVYRVHSMWFTCCGKLLMTSLMFFKISKRFYTWMLVLKYKDNFEIEMSSVAIIISRLGHEIILVICQVLVGKLPSTLSASRELQISCFASLHR